VEGEEYYEIIAHSPLMYVGREITVYYDQISRGTLKPWVSSSMISFWLESDWYFLSLELALPHHSLRNSDFANGCWKPAGQYTQTLVKSLWTQAIQ